MKKNEMNEWEEKMYDLLVEKSFDDLTEKQQEWVLQYLSKADYNAQHEVMQLTNEDFSEEFIPNPGPLMVLDKNQPKKMAFLSRKVPVYQLFMVAAACFLVFFLFSPLIQHTHNEVNEGKEYLTYHDTIVQYDTVFIEKIEKDTIYKTIEKEVPVSVTINQNTCNDEPPRLLEVNENSIALPVLNQSTTSNKGSAIQTDPTNILIQDYLGSVYPDEKKM